MTPPHAPSPSGPAIVVSPHFDDAVFGCGEWLAAHPGTIVVTVFAGVPVPASQRREWDRRSGFSSAGEAVAARSIEDAQAIALLGAQPLWLDFRDGQYDDTPSLAAVADALRSLIAELRPATVMLPLGLFHPDHCLAHEATLAALRGPSGHGVGRIMAYEECLYRCMPGVLQARLALMQADGVHATPAADDASGHATAKQSAARCYASQWLAFGAAALDDVWRAERRWELLLDADRVRRTEHPSGSRSTLNTGRPSPNAIPKLRDDGRRSATQDARRPSS